MIEHEKSTYDHITFDLPFILRNVKNWLFASFCLACICGIALFVLKDSGSQATYTATAYVTIAGKSNNSTFQTDSALDTAMNRNVSMWNSKVLRKVIKEANPDIQASGSLEASVIEDTGIIQLEASASTAKDAYYMLNGAIQNYKEVAANFDNSYRTILLTEINPYAISCSSSSSLPYAILGFGGGFCLALGIVVLWSMITGLLHSEEQVEKALDAPALGCIPMVKPPKKGAKVSLFWDREKLPVDYLESMDMLTSRLEQAMHHENKKTLMITSTFANDGKTTLASNLSLALAARKRKVLLIEMDLRNPTLHKVFGQEKLEDKDWFYSVQKKLRLANYVIPYEENPNLDIIYQFQPVRDSDSFIENSPIGKKIDRLADKYDYIILDTPPMGVVRDTEVIARFAECAMLVTRQDICYAKNMNDCIERLENNGTSCIGVVLNACKGLPLKSGKKNHKKHAGHHSKRGAQESHG